MKLMMAGPSTSLYRPRIRRTQMASRDEHLPISLPTSRSFMLRRLLQLRT